MIIKADKEGHKLIAELADMLLKVGGLQVYNKVGILLNSVSLVEENTGINESPQLKLEKNEDRT